MILVVEDNTGNQYVARILVERLGLKVQIADNGAEALEALESQDFDMIFMDCRMPVLDGFETTMAIRSAEAKTGKHTPIVGLTACALEGDREKCLAAGMDDYLSKPLS